MLYILYSKNCFGFSDDSNVAFSDERKIESELYVNNLKIQIM